MRSKLLIAPFAIAATYSFTAFASSPPVNSLPLSDVVKTVEELFDPKYIDEVSWDSDGYWEVEYVDQNGSEREIKIDPLTGKIR